ncbi:MAG: transporter substrate-binding domain-containing protein, partial [Gammaproteobacteria bacterium]|nr:transporter substrate-binding domain-containing protein [Gammaproteobacteria bacterium]
MNNADSYLKRSGNKYWVLVLFLLLSGCGSSDRLDAILKNKTLTVVTRNAPTTWYEDRDGTAGFEYELVNHFASSLGVKVNVINKDSVSEIIEVLRGGTADIAAAGLTRTAERENGFSFGPEYYQVRQQVVCRRGGATPVTIAELVNIQLTVPVNSSYAEKLAQLKNEYSDLSWQLDDTVNTEALLEMVWDKKLECTIADSNIVAVNRRYLPELSVRFDISDPEPLAWMIPNTADGLSQALDDW